MNRVLNSKAREVKGKRVWPSQGRTAPEQSWEKSKTTGHVHFAPAGPGSLPFPDLEETLVYLHPVMESPSASSQPGASRRP